MKIFANEVSVFLRKKKGNLPFTYRQVSLETVKRAVVESHQYRENKTYYICGEDFGEIRAFLLDPDILRACFTLVIEFDHSEALGEFADYFRDGMKEIAAAGGIVTSEDKDQLLMIKRMGMWDLPKGKVEKREELVDAAEREVMEECGIDDLFVSDLAGTTFHFYKRKGRWEFKTTYWYWMTAKPGKSGFSPVGRGYYRGQMGSYRSNNGEHATNLSAGG